MVLIKILSIIHTHRSILTMDFLRIWCFAVITSLACSFENLAINKTATMSSSRYADKWLASAAIDGNKNQSLDGNSCAVTSDDFKPEAWWKVDLGGIRSVDQVKIYYRDESDGISYTYELSGFYIYISNSSTMFGTECYKDNGGVQTNPGPSSISTFPCYGTGRYLTIYKSKKHTCTSSSGNRSYCAHLQLCEIEVLENLAINKTATMSSSQYADKWLASAAIDGNKNQSLDGNSCAVTSDDYKPEAWWKVDLGGIRSVDQVKIYYRDESDGVWYTYQLSGFYIYISNSSNTFGTECYKDNGGEQANPGPSSISTFPCYGTGRYLTIYKSRKQTCTKSTGNKNLCSRLRLCEVEVLGYVKREDCPSNCLEDICSKDNICFECKNGFKGITCDKKCDLGKFGKDCSQLCSTVCGRGSNCHHASGECEKCDSGWRGVDCKQRNVALHRAATMSTSLYTDKWLAGEAVDGDVNQTLDRNSCAVTSDNYKVEAWWKVDLGGIFNITMVKIFYRDNYDGFSWTFRLSGFFIYVSNDTSSLGTACYVNNGGVQGNPGPDSISLFSCEAIGRTVTIYKSREDTCRSNSGNKNFCSHLELCEVEVIGYVNTDNCPDKCFNNLCDDIGQCSSCKDGYTGTYCNTICERGTYGKSCSQKCSSSCEKGNNCHHETGTCATVCDRGWKGRYCDQKCAENEYGVDCLRTCDNCASGGCDPQDGVCLNGCIDGWSGPSCSFQTDKNLTVVAIALGVGLFIVVVINVMLILKHYGCSCCNKKRRYLEEKNETPDVEERNLDAAKPNRNPGIAMTENSVANYERIIPITDNPHIYTGL